MDSRGAGADEEIGTARPAIGPPRKKYHDVTYPKRNLMINNEQVRLVDEEAERRHMSRSEAIRAAATDWVRRAAKDRERDCSQERRPGDHASAGRSHSERSCRHTLTTATSISRNAPRLRRMQVLVWRSLGQRDPRLACPRP